MTNNGVQNFASYQKLPPTNSSYRTGNPILLANLFEQNTSGILKEHCPHGD